MTRRRSGISKRWHRRQAGDNRPVATISHARTGFTIAGVLIVVMALAIVVTRRGVAAHPAPRPGVTGEKVVTHTHFADYPRVEKVYKDAKEIPEVLDGLHCYCDCGMHSGHYSLLDCFKSEHGAGCDICLTEAAMAYDMHKQGKSLDEIRTAIDHVFAN